MKKRHAVLLTVALSSFLLGYGVVAHAWPLSTLTISPNVGYFTGAFDTWGDNVLPPSGGPAGCAGDGNAIPAWINTPSEFINFILCKKNNGSAREKTGADFIIQTMIGSSRTKPPTAAQIQEWEDRINFLWYIGKINFNATFSYTVNTYWQGNGGGGSDPDDDAFYADNASAAAITFADSSGVVRYAIRKPCGNPVGNGNFSAIQNNPSFNMSGTAFLDNASPAPGDTIHFTYSLTSSGATSPLSISWFTEIVTGVYTPYVSGNAGTFTAGQTKTIGAGAETYTVPIGTAAGTKICRRIAFDPDTSSGGTDVSNTVCATVTPGYALTPGVGISINGGATAGSVAQPGDTVAFAYDVNNTDAGDSPPVSCTIYAKTFSGAHTAPTPPEDPVAGGWGTSGVATGCPRSFPANTDTSLATETLSSAATTGLANQTVCRSLFVNPTAPGVGSTGDEACVTFAAAPYMRVYGGDVSAGNGLASGGSCTTSNTNAAIVGWNKRSAGGWAGAGAEYAAYALDSIFDFSSSLGGAGASMPSGLSFSNQGTNASAGLFGTDFGSVPCIPDYYSTRPASTLALPADINAMVTGNYGATGATYFGGSGAVGAGERIVVYVDGDAYINTNIAYSGSWSTATMPSFEMIVRGNIYIDLGVSRLDGLFVAQKDASGNKGIIYTCSSTIPSWHGVVPTDSTFSSQCDNNKLTVNGGLVANSIQFGRTQGTLSKSTTGETGASGAAAEVINYSPIMWIPQPSVTGTGGYDSITSLAPIL